MNPNALKEADERDRERAQGQLRGPLHGIPDRAQGQHPHDRHADDGRRARVRESRAAYEATLTKNLEDAGAIIIAKTRTDRARELGRRRADADAGQLQRRRRLGLQPVRSADAIRATATFDGRPALSTGGSSSGIGTAANFWAGNVGTRDVRIDSRARRIRTCWPAIKPTVGRISRYGVIPITADQDTAGPDGEAR